MNISELRQVGGGAGRQGQGASERDGSPSNEGKTRPTILLTSDPLHAARLVPCSNGAWLTLLARVLAPSLDCQLASGTAPASSRLLAARAQMLVAPKMSLELSEDWQRLLEHARRLPVPRHPPVPLCRDRILAAEDEIRQMLSELVKPRPTPVRGIAMALCLLRDGAGPLYNRHCSTDLRATLRVLATHLDPSVSLAELS